MTSQENKEVWTKQIKENLEQVEGLVSQSCIALDLWYQVRAREITENLRGNKAGYICTDLAELGTFYKNVQEELETVAYKARRASMLISS